MGRIGKRAGLLLLCLLLLLGPVSVRAAESAEEITGRCVLTCTGEAQGKEARLTDGKMDKACALAAGDVLTLRSDRDMATLHLRFHQFRASFLLLERDGRGVPLSLRALTADAILWTVALSDGCRYLELRPLEARVDLCEVAVYGPGPLPEDVPDPEPSLEKADFLLVATHPDDEWVYLGGVYPTYGGERGYAGTVVYMTLPTWERAHESVNGMWIGGLRTYPYFLGFPDIRKNAPQNQKDLLRREDVVLALVRLYRRIRPLVVVTQDPENGEYGHWQHKLSASAAYEAVALAADPTYDPDSAAQYGTWTVKKVYQHFAQGISALELDVNTPLSRYGGRTALEVARAAYKAHRTQQKTKYLPGAQRATRGDIVHFGLTWSAVGPDTGADLFEHIPQRWLAAAQIAE